ncbi:universal stress protein [Nocardioides sp. R-C-SC26]|uniref:universal stress protein n=1 Tax=Nocardioides sp. R-C-SC26 TaxID=2870414 RepID=UPI001E5B182F|nr:universal stress protein [Nocardioides sp. R-C-SC26]
MSVIVAYSADEFGTAALRHGSEVARAQGARLILVNATAGQKLVDPRYAADEEIDAVVGELRATGIEVDVRHELVDDVADAVLGAARESSARLIVVGVRKRTPVGKLLLGSVAQRVILEADCPVLAVKP